MSIKQTNYKEPIRSEGCCFCCDCYLAGLDNSHNIEEAFDYAVDNKWIRKKDCYVLNHKDLIDGLAIKYRTSKKSGNRVNVGNHFVIKDTNGNVIYNPA